MGRPAHRGRCERACICLRANRDAACRRPLRGADSSRALVRTQPPPRWTPAMAGCAWAGIGAGTELVAQEEAQEAAREEQLLSWCSWLPRPCMPSLSAVGKVHNCRVLGTASAVARGTQTSNYTHTPLHNIWMIRV